MSREELSNSFIETFKPYSFRNWDKKIFEVSQPYFEVRIDTIELITLVTNQHKFIIEERSLDEFKFFKELKELVEREFKGKKFFAKFFTRSAKDIEVIYDCPYELMDCFLSSMRVFEDMCVVRNATKDTDQIVIYIRPLVEFDKKNEYRLFHVNGFTSVCNYHKQDAKEIHSSIIDSDILQWNEERIKPFVGVVDYCIDFIKHNDRIELIEINPYNLSDPILLDHTKFSVENQQIKY